MLHMRNKDISDIILTFSNSFNDLTLLVVPQKSGSGGNSVFLLQSFGRKKSTKLHVKVR